MTIYLPMVLLMTSTGVGIVSIGRMPSQIRRTMEVLPNFLDPQILTINPPHLCLLRTSAAFFNLVQHRSPRPVAAILTRSGSSPPRGSSKRVGPRHLANLKLAQVTDAVGLVSHSGNSQLPK